MRRNLLLTSIGGVAALALFGVSAVAAPGHFGAQSSAGLVTLAHHSGGSNGHAFQRGPWTEHAIQKCRTPLQFRANLPRPQLLS